MNSQGKPPLGALSHVTGQKLATTIENSIWAMPKPGQSATGYLSRGICLTPRCARSMQVNRKEIVQCELLML